VQQRQLRLTLEVLSERYDRHEVLPQYRYLSFAVLNHPMPSVLEEHEEDSETEEGVLANDREEHPV
jgi:hypothetical protein